MDVQIILKLLNDSKELLTGVMDELRRQRLSRRLG
jgi:hypothetical protein